MSLKWRYRIVHFIVFGLFTALAVYTFQENLKYLLLAEFVILILIVLSFNLFRALFLPIDQIKLGIDTIKDQDFTVKITETGLVEVDEMIKVYNALIENIRRERRFQKEQHFFLSQLIDNLPLAVFILDFDDKISEYNPSAAQLFQLNESSIGTAVFEVLPFLQSVSLEPTFSIKRYNNNYFRITINNFVHKGFNRKLIMLEEVSREVFAIEKKAYDKVIRMMAHEVKNSVGAVNSILDELRKEVSEEECNLLEISIRRNLALNQFINHFAKVVRIPEANLQRTELVAWAEEVLTLMKSKALEADVQLTFIKPIMPVYADIDTTLMEQVLINVLLNAIEASIGADKRVVELEISPNKIIVTDFGSGIPEKLQNELFTPFFTTKPQGQGVGLTMVRDILKKHNFTYTLKSNDGKTEFCINISSTSETTKSVSFLS